MKVLSVKQPWAYAICAGIQDVFSLRVTPRITSPTKLLICATKHPVPDYFDRMPDDRNSTIKNARLMGIIPPYQDLIYNAIIGYVECTEITQNDDSFWAETAQYDWENPTYNMKFQNPFMFDEPIPVRSKNYGIFFNVAISPKDLLKAHKVPLTKPFLDGDCLKMPAALSVLKEIDDGIKSIMYDLCDTSMDFFIDPQTGEPYSVESIDFMGKDRTIHKHVSSIETGHYVDEDDNPVYYQGYDIKENKIWRVITFGIE